MFLLLPVENKVQPKSSAKLKCVVCHEEIHFGCLEK